MGKYIVSAVLAVLMVPLAFGIEDEPDELNWERLGGSVTGFNHFLKYCGENQLFTKKLLGEKPVADAKLDKELETVWVSAEAFADAKIKQWDLQTVEGEQCIVGPGAHNGSMVRIAVDIPKDGYYRIWAKYWHEYDFVSAFNFILGDGRMADLTDGSLTFAQDQFEYRFDWAEWAHQGGEVLPNRKAEPRGWIWESTPMTFIRKGRYSLTLHGLTCDGNFQSRIVNAIVFTQDPLAVPEKPAGDGAILTASKAPSAEVMGFKKIWDRRPFISLAGNEPSEALKQCWLVWRKALIADILADRLEGVEGKRMASMVYFDEESNLLGRPAYVESEKQNIKAVFANISRDWGWRKKIEAENFTPGNSGWWVEGSGDASGSAILVEGYWGGASDVYTDVEVPKAGEYNIWLRYYEVYGYLARYWFFVEDSSGNRIHGEELAADWTYNQQHGGFSWRKIRITAPDDCKLRFRLYKDEGASTYRRVDAVIVSDNDEYVPEGAEDFFIPYDTDREVTVWNKPDPWGGYFRTTGPSDTDNLNPVDVPLREGEAQTFVLLARNNTERTLDITPKIRGDRDGLVEWRVPALVLGGDWQWNPQPLLKRDHYYVPAGETVGVWLTVHGRPGFGARTVCVEVGGQAFEMRVTKLEPYPDSVPVPYVYGWSTPYQRLSCWELYKELGVNCIGDMLVPKADADRYGIKLTLHLNDAWMDEGHVRGVVKRFLDQGYDYKDWTWSFMDEPGNDGQINQWLECAAKMKEWVPEVKLWANPGEATNETGARMLRILPYVNDFCPYFNHFSVASYSNPEYYSYLQRNGDNKFDIFMYYTTPCFGEKAPNAPWDLLGLYGTALSGNLDGWAFFALQYAFEYSNSIWDDAHNYMGDQAVSIYRGAASRTISTRNAEALREGVQRYRLGKFESMGNK